MALRVVLCVLLSWCLAQHAWSVEKSAAPYTQGVLARDIVTLFGWQGGLPKEPADRDFLQILGGKRTYRYEAETAYNAKTDPVSFWKLKQFGPFTGKGWLMGSADPTFVNLTILLPIGGEYTLTSVQRGGTFIWNIGGREYFSPKSSTGDFSPIEIAKVDLKPGVHQIRVNIPPSGAIDSFTLKAADHVSVQPFAGWRFREPLTAARLAEVGAALANSFSALPEMKAGVPPSVSVAEAVQDVPGLSRSGDRSYGAFESASWLHADYRTPQIKIPLQVGETGYYGIALNIFGSRIEGMVNETPFRFSGGAILQRRDIGLHRLESGENQLVVTIPPRGGIDRVYFSRRDTSEAAFMKLMGIAGDPGRLIPADEARRFLKNMSEKYPVRK